VTTKSQPQPPPPPPNTTDNSRSLLSTVLPTATTTSTETEQLTEAERQHLLPTRKYPFVKDQHVSVDEIRKRVNHGTMGVVPVRDSQKISDLNVVMKGKSVTAVFNHPNRSIFHDISDAEEDEDEEVIETNEEGVDGEFSIKARINLNTPATLSYHDLSRTDNKNESTTIRAESMVTVNDEDLSPFSVREPRPAILPEQGHSTVAKLSERPKPAKKVRTHYSPPVKQQQRVKDEQQLISTANMTENELQQYELLRQVKSMVAEAKQLTNSSMGSMTKVKAQIQQRRGTRINLNNNAGNNNDGNENGGGADAFDNEEALREQQLLKSVEELLTAIKSGQLIREQEMSNAKILEILGNVLDKDSLQQLDIMTDSGSVTRKEGGGGESSERFYGEQSKGKWEKQTKKFKIKSIKNRTKKGGKTNKNL
jgi:hypothetical protein